MENKKRGMTIGKALLWIASITVGGGVLGLAAGLFIGSVFPGYYKAVFPSASDPLQFGAGAGIVQGLIMGFVAGLVIVVLVTWHQTRTWNP